MRSTRVKIQRPPQEQKNPPAKLTRKYTPKIPPGSCWVVVFYCLNVYFYILAIFVDLLSIQRVLYIGNEMILTRLRKLLNGKIDNDKT